MSVEAMATLFNDVELRLSSVLTAENASKVLEILSDELNSYTLVRIAGLPEEKDMLLDAYVSALEIEGKSKKTIERYVYIIKRMMAEVKVPTSKITVYHLRGYLASEKARGVGDSTLEGTRQVFTAYFNWLQRECLIKSNPTANLGVIKRQKKIREAYTEVDIEKLKAGCNTLRDKAIICFLASSGCRISEVIGLNRDAVNLYQLEAKVLGKGNKERKVYLSPVAGEALRQYLESRDDDCEPLFLNRYNQRLTPSGVRAMLKELAAKTNVEHVHPHKFRRTLATNLIRHGMPIQEVSRILGHDKLDTTMKYVVLNDRDVKNSYERYA